MPKGPCLPDCTCGKHAGGPWKNKTLSEEHRMRIGKGLKRAAANGVNVGGKGTPRPKFDAKHSKNLSDALKVRMRDPEVRANHIAGMVTRNYENIFAHGGIGHETNQSMLDFAAILCPAGYLMDKVTVSLGPPHGGCYTLDFAHPEVKVDIEIDGSSHKHHKERDAKRDAFLRNLGWKVIRIKV